MLQSQISLHSEITLVTLKDLSSTSANAEFLSHSHVQIPLLFPAHRLSALVYTCSRQTLWETCHLMGDTCDGCASMHTYVNIHTLSLTLTCLLLKL